MTLAFAGFHIAVAVTSDPPRQMTLLEHFVYRLGPIARTEKACNLINLILCLGALAYIVTWSAVFALALAERPGVSPTHLMALSVAWTPMLACTVFIGAVRYACLTLKLKEIRAMADATEHNFHEAVMTAVTRAVSAFHDGAADRELPKKPTLQ